MPKWRECEHGIRPSKCLPCRAAYSRRYYHSHLEERRARVRADFLAGKHHRFDHICESCGKKFRSTEKGSRYCGHQCAGLARRGAAHPGWVGGRTVSVDGYINVRVDGRYVREHRYVMEQVLGRPLRPDEEVHHKNGDRADNRPDNIELWYHSQPPGQRVSDVAFDALSRLSDDERAAVIDRF